MEDDRIGSLYEIYPSVFDLRADTPWPDSSYPAFEFDHDDLIWSEVDVSATPSSDAPVPLDPIPWNPYAGEAIDPPSGPWQPDLPPPPPDVLGFYLPFHRFFRPRSHQQVWGIYLFASAIAEFGSWIHHETGGRIPLRSCRKVAQSFVYWHEFFHHRAESLVTRLEVAAGGERAYLGRVRRKFTTGLSKGECREEALAEGFALYKVRAETFKKIEPALNRIDRQALMLALRKYCKATGPPYSAGVALEDRGKFETELNILSEDYRREDLYDPRTLEHQAWLSVPHTTRGIKTVRQSFWYIWDLPGLPVHPDIHPWTRVKARDLLALATRQGFEKVSQRGSHVKMKSPGGVTIIVPVHRGRDISTGVAAKILKQIGLGWSDLKRTA